MVGYKHSTQYSRGSGNMKETFEFRPYKSACEAIRDHYNHTKFMDLAV